MNTRIIYILIIYISIISCQNSIENNNKINKNINASSSINKSNKFTFVNVKLLKKDTILPCGIIEEDIMNHFDVKKGKIISYPYDISQINIYNCDKTDLFLYEYFINNKYLNGIFGDSIHIVNNLILGEQIQSFSNCLLKDNKSKIEILGYETYIDPRDSVQFQYKNFLSNLSKFEKKKLFCLINKNNSLKKCNEENNFNINYIHINKLLKQKIISVRVKDTILDSVYLFISKNKNKFFAIYSQNEPTIESVNQIFTVLRNNLYYIKTKIIYGTQQKIFDLIVNNKDIISCTESDEYESYDTSEYDKKNNTLRLLGKKVSNINDRIYAKVVYKIYVKDTIGIKYYILPPIPLPPHNQPQ